MLNLQNLNPQAVEPSDGYSKEDKNVINSMYNILKDDGINVKLIMEASKNYHDNPI